MFRRKKPSTPSAPADQAGREDVLRADAAEPSPDAAPSADAEPRVTPFPSREPRLEAVRSPDAGAGSAPERPQQETRPPMSDKTPTPPRPNPPSSGATHPSGPPSPPARNPLSHLPNIGEPMRRASYPGMPGGERGERGRPVVEGRKLIVGRDIELTGSIAACDTLVVEGRVESDVTGANTIEVATTGTFQGSAEVEHAEIAGTFEGTLTVKKKLSLTRSGRITGTVRYATLEVEAGGQIQGDMEVIAAEPSAT